jgi:hypothetical protein
VANRSASALLAELTEKWIRRATHRSTVALEAAIKHWLAAWNGALRPFVWTRTAEKSPRHAGLISSANLP